MGFLFLAAMLVFTTLLRLLYFAYPRFATRLLLIPALAKTSLALRVDRSVTLYSMAPISACYYFVTAIYYFSFSS